MVRRILLLLPVLLCLFCCCVQAREITLGRALEEAEENNLQIQAARQRYGASLEQMKSAYSLSNPELTVAPTIAGEDGSDSELTFSQNLELNGSRAVRGKLARSRAAEQKALMEKEISEILFSVKSGYWEWLGAIALERRYEQEVLYNAHFLETVEKQIAAGAAPGYQLAKAEIELASSRQALAAAAAEKVKKEKAFRLLLNSDGEELTPAQELVFLPCFFSKEKIMRLALENSPEISFARAAVESARYERLSSVKKMLPDLELQARKPKFNSEPGVALALTIPLWDWGGVSHEIRSAERVIEAEELSLEQAMKNLMVDTENAYSDFETAFAAVRTYEDGILGRARTLTELAEKGYGKGAMTYLDVLEARRTYLELSSSAIEALARYNISVARLEQICGAASEEFLAAEEHHAE